jgi:hypothetical protein
MKTLIYEISGKKYTYECGPDTIQFSMNYKEVEEFFFNEFADLEDFYICGWM